MKPPKMDAAAMGRKGGRTKGKSKARTSAQARKAARARWARSNHMKP